jgi:hypothetical protein
MSPTDAKLGFATSVGRAGVPMLVVVVVGQIAGENVNGNIKPLRYSSNWEKWKYCVLSAARLTSKEKKNLLDFLIFPSLDKISFATSTDYGMDRFHC